ncbi:MAG: hypothetical protein IJE07_01165 [Clostridia bacterium]|nr:hypothetical protein [Clostridia bacterium]
MKYVLFSPIGMSDPIANSRDAAWLHILRHYQPEFCVAYMTAAVCQVEDVMGELAYTLDQLNRHLFGSDASRHIRVEWMRDEDCVAAHSMEYFFPKFRVALERLHEQYPQATLLVNVTSGTAGMQVALTCLRELLPFNVTLVQVSNSAFREKPVQKAREIQAIDLDTYWEDNQDNEPDQPNRTSEQPMLNYALQMAVQRICERIEAGDYHAAKILADNRMPFKASQAILGAEDRVCMRLEAAGSKLAQSGMLWGNELKAHAGDRLWQCVEYFLGMEIDQKSGAVDDLLRKLTPLLYNLSILYAAEIGMDVLSDEYSMPYRSTRKWNKGQYMPAWMQQHTDLVQLGDRWLAADGILQLIEHRVSDDDIFKKLKDLRDVEMLVRNVVAHEIVPFSDRMIAGKQVDAGQIMTKIRAVLQHLMKTAGMAEDCLTQGYRPMNDHIIDLLNAVVGDQS